MEKTFTITNNYLDRYDHLKPSAILDLCQEIASNNADLLHVGFDDVYSKGIIWVVVRNYVEILKPYVNPKEVKIKTDIAQTRAFQCPRDYVLYVGDEEIIRARSIWMMYDLKTQKVVDPIIFDTLKTNEEGLYKRIKKLDHFEKSELEFIKEIDVPFTYLDHNGHMNNTHYLDLFLDVYEPKKEEIIKSFQVEYVEQCFLDEKLSLYKKEIDGSYYLYGYSGDHLKFYLKVDFVG